MRHHDWQLRLEAFARDRAAMPFAWGSNDCACFAADAVEAMTGVRYFPHLRGLDARGALAALRKQAGLRSIATQALGAPVSAKMAAVGDVVRMPRGKRDMLAVCNGITALAPGPSGTVALPMVHAFEAWKVR